MERDTVSVEAEPLRPEQQPDRHFRLASELARQRPFGAVALDQETAIDPGAGRGVGDLFEFRVAVEGEHAHAQGIGARDIRFFLDGIAEGDAGRRDAVTKAEIDFGQAGHVEVGAKQGQSSHDLVGRVRLDGIEDIGQRERPGQRHVVMLDDIDIDHQAGVGQVVGRQVVGDTRRHVALLIRQADADRWFGDKRRPQLQGGRGVVVGRKYSRSGDFARLGSKHRHTPSRPGIKPAGPKRTRPSLRKPIRARGTCDSV